MLSLVPMGLWPYGCASPYTSAAKARSAMAGPRSCSCSRPVVRSLLRRRNSFSGKVGRSTTSAISPIALSSVAVVECTAMVLCSKPALVRSPIARKPICSARPSASRVPAPSSSRFAVSVASPAFPLGSASAPVRITSDASTTGISCCSTITSLRPLGSTRSVMVGSVSALGAASLGGVVDAACGAEACACSIAGAAASEARTNRVRRISGDLLRSARGPSYLRVPR